ncbi:hypothetical protein G5V65_15370 [Rhodobacter sp. HX-7-19]|uniref:Uncharacterized protein n=1 Tax=Paragemmobacter kunshanensis TaxID=2583234 RepID=A0A6M1U046_9RHOB|nr:hypothetical protein [Rhodobacter kunshanensis]NGQ92276.1 hypothetical protein [Rhodobacter kunshanensis]
MASVPGFPQPRGTGAQQRQKPALPGRGFKLLQGHGQRRIGQSAQILGQAVEIELVRLREIHHFALIH